MSAPHPETWLYPRPEGLFCEPGGFFIDPLRGVDRAVVTHGHSDHARPGNHAVLASGPTLAIMQARGVSGRSERAVAWGERVRIGDVTLWLEPAGHVLGSAQVAMAYRGSRAVVSGDYKRAPDATCDAFVPVPCDVFVTEATCDQPPWRPRRTWSAGSCWRPPPPSPTAGRGGWRTPWCASRRAGCGCASAPDRAASSCR